MGLYNAELFNNLGLCCFYAQQYDMTLSCFQHALSLAKDDDVADIWYNIGLIAIVSIKTIIDINKFCRRVKAIHVFSSHPGGW